MSDIGHPDAAQDQAMLEPLIQAIQYLNEKVEKLEKLVIDDLIGGITGLYKDNQRTTGIAGLKERYGATLDPIAPHFGTMFGGKDLYEKLYETLEELKEQDGFDEGGAVNGIAGEIQKVIDSIRGIEAKQESGETKPEGEGAGVSVTKVEAIPVEEDELAQKLGKIREYKNKGAK